MEPLAYGAIGVITGASITILGNFILFSLKENKEDVKQRYKAYNKILEINAKFKIVSEDHTGYKFNSEKYKEELIPVIFSEFHILPNKIQNKISILEDAYKGEYTVLPHEWADVVSSHYIGFIDLIREQYDSRLIRFLRSPYTINKNN